MYLTKAQSSVIGAARLALVAQLIIFGLPSPARASDPVPVEMQIRGSNHVVKLTLTAYQNSLGRAQVESDAGAGPPVIRIWPGDTLRITYRNHLPVTSEEPCATGPCMNMTNLHFHGLTVSPARGQDDVLGMMARPGETLEYSVRIPPEQTPGLFWYHTHPHGESMRQDLDGMSGAIVVEGIDRYVPEVRHLRERIFVLRARAIDPHARDVATLMNTLEVSRAACGTGNHELERIFTVNNALAPSIDIAPGERQFWRFVNAAPDRYIDLTLDGQRFKIVAFDGMPLAYSSPTRTFLEADHILLPPAGRVEAIVTGPSSAPNSNLRSACVDTGPDGDWNPGMMLANIVPVTRSAAPLESVPIDNSAPIRKIVDLTRFENNKPDFTVEFSEDKQGFYINGQKFRPNAPPMDRVRVGSFQHWRIVNSTQELHPMHIHQVHFFVYAVNGQPITHPVWMDTANVPVAGNIDVIMDFTDPVIRGMSVFHCHLLNHEDKGMMAKVLFE